MPYEKLTVIPLTWRQACAFNDEVHRHHKAPRGCKFAIGVIDSEGRLRGTALAGRPVARALDDGFTLEINRTATDGCRNANSMLYGACWRIGSAMGYRRIVTYTQKGESGASLKAGGFILIRTLAPRGSWAGDSIKLRHIRSAQGNGGIERNLWQRG